MNAPKLEFWLIEKVHRSSLLAILGAVGLAIAGALAVYITFWAFYVALWSWVPKAAYFGLGRNQDTAKTFAWVLVGLTFLGRLTFFRRHLDNYEFETGSVRRTISLTSARATGHSLLALAAGPKTALSFLKLLASLLCIGPAILHQALDLVILAVRLRRLDTASCAPIIAALYKADKKVSFDELFRKVPVADPSAVLAQLQHLDGVVFRTSDPPGLSLAGHLREEIDDWRKLRSRIEPGAE